MSRDPDLRTLRIHPGVSLRIELTVPRKDRPLHKVRLDGPRRRALARWLLDNLERDDDSGPVEIGEDLASLAIEVGVLLDPAELPEEAVPFRCSIDEEVTSLITREASTEASSAVSGDLRPNPAHHLQTSAELPSAVAQRLRVGADAWRHLPPHVLPRGPTRFAQDRPLVWLENPRTQVLQPLWIPGPAGSLVLDVLGGRTPVGALPTEDRQRLLLADVLIEDARAEGREESTEDLADRLRSEHSVVLRRVVSPMTMAAMRRYFRQLRSAGLFELDVVQVRNMREGIYCEVVSLHLQHQLAGFLNRILPLPVEPSYTWFMRYLPGAALVRHTDRAQCHWNVSLCVDMEPDLGRDGAWPLCFEVDGRPCERRLGIGDAVLYSGTDTPHWRDALAADRAVSMCLFHYVTAGYEGSRA